ncbi:MAG TPA: hypothetical protein VEU96_28120 [Bryobacteraceae bacterium]|nr:hypothetical protein [Bryobacteraceae bacterium]
MMSWKPRACMLGWVNPLEAKHRVGGRNKSDPIDARRWAILPRSTPGGDWVDAGRSPAGGDTRVGTAG